VRPRSAVLSPAPVFCELWAKKDVMNFRRCSRHVILQVHESCLFSTAQVMLILLCFSRECEVLGGTAVAPSYLDPIRLERLANSICETRTITQKRLKVLPDFCLPLLLYMNKER